MTDLDGTVRAAIDAATERVVAPPFAAVAHRRTRRRLRTAAVVAAAGVATFAVAVLGVPRLDEVPPLGGRLKPWESLLDDESDFLDVSECVTGHVAATPAEVAACYARSGYDAPPDNPPPGYPRAEDATVSGWTTCAPPPAATPVTTVGSGDAGSTRWRVLAWEGVGGARCTSWRTDSAADLEMHSDAEDDHGPVGALRPAIHWAPIQGRGPDTWVVVWGALAPNVARVSIVTSTGTYDVATRTLPDAPDRAHLGTAVRVAGRDVTWRARYYDAQGREVGRYP